MSALRVAVRRMWGNWGVISRIGVASVAIVFSVPDAVGFGASALAAQKPATVTINVTYPWRDCESASKTTPTPLPGAKIEIRRAYGGQKAEGRLSANGRFSVKLRGSGRMSVLVTLESPQLSVTPYGRVPDPYTFTKLLPEHQQGTYPIVLSGDAQAGAANIWNVLWHAAQAAKQMEGKDPSFVAAYWRFNTDFKTPVPGMEKNTALVSQHRLVIGNPGREWEPWPLYHEYGHHVLNDIAHPGPASTIDVQHVWTRSYPEAPGLAWSDGWAHAFAAAMINDNGQLSLSCGKTRVFLSWMPVGPKYTDPTRAQYNEMAAAAALWQSARLVGSGKPQVGLGMILQAAKAYKKYAGRDPWSVRQVRDAIERADLAAGNSATENQIERIFQSQDISWGFGVQAGLCPVHRGLTTAPSGTTARRGFNSPYMALEHTTAAAQATPTKRTRRAMVGSRTAPRMTAMS